MHAYQINTLLLHSRCEHRKFKLRETFLLNYNMSIYPVLQITIISSQAGHVAINDVSESDQSGDRTYFTQGLLNNRYSSMLKKRIKAIPCIYATVCYWPNDQTVHKLEIMFLIIECKTIFN